MRPPDLSRLQPGLTILLLTVTVLIFVRTIALVERDPELTFFYNLPPFFDGVQYFAEAASLTQEASARIWINGEQHPSIYPFGYSLVIGALIPFVQEPVGAAYLANVVASALILVVSGLITWRLYGLLAAAVVVLVIAACPSFIILGNSPLSGSTAGLVVIASVGAWLRYAVDGKSVWGVAASLLVGIGVWFKTGFVFFVPLLLFGTLAPRNMTRPRRIQALIVHSAAALIGVAPVLIYNWVMFGSPLRTGYHYWSGPGLLANIGARPRFALANVWPRIVDLAHEALQLPLAFNTANIFASGSWISGALVLLFVVASIVALRRRMWLCVMAGSSLYLFSMLSYYRYFGRMYFPLYLVAALATGHLVAALVNMQPGGRRRVYTAALGLLLVASVVGFSRPSSQLELPGLLNTARFERQVAANFLLARAVGAEVVGRECLVVTDLLTPFVSAIVGPPVRILSLDGDRPFAQYSPYRFSTEARDQAIAAAVRSHGCLVVALAGAYSDLASRLPPAEEFVWETFYRVTHRGPREFGAAKLVPRSDDAPGAR